MLGKLGELLNKDVGSIVKDAGKVLNSDVGEIVKGAGKVLNSDVGNLLKDKPAETATPEEKAKAAAAARAAAIAAAALKVNPPSAAQPAASAVTPERAPAAKPEAPVTRPEAPAAKPAQPADPVSRRADDGDKTMLMPKFDPNATLQLNRPPLEGAAVPAQNVNGDSTTGRSVTEVLAAPPPAPLVGVHADAAAALPILNEETANRLRRPAPSGTSLVVLLPHDVGDFSRPHAVPSGELASDFVSANYGAGGDTVVVRLALCWDSDEAREPLDRLIREHGDKARAAADGSWVLAETAQGITFAWTRDSYSFSASCAKGLGPLSRFLWAFPY